MWRGIRAAFSGTPGNWNPLSSSLIPLFPPVCYVRWRLRSTWPYAGIQLLPPPSVMGFGGPGLGQTLPPSGTLLATRARAFSTMFLYLEIPTSFFGHLCKLSMLTVR